MSHDDFDVITGPSTEPHKPRQAPPPEPARNAPAEPR